MAKSTVGDSSSSAISWSTAGAVFSLALLVLGLAFWSSYSAIVSIWLRSETFAHGFLILPISAYLIWRKRDELACVGPRPAPRVLVLIFGLAMFWLLGYVADVTVLQQLAAVVMVPMLAWAVLGTEVVRRIAFPLGYLFFAVPIGDFLVPPLQDLTAALTVWALQMTDIPVYWEGRFFYIPTGAFEVAEACSGVRYLIASLALGTLYAYLTYVSLWRRLLFVAMSAVVPLAANGLRAYGIVMLAHLSDYKLAVGVDHIVYGWMFFGVVILALFWVGSLFREEPSPERFAQETVLNKQTMITSVGTFVTWAVLGTVLAASGPGMAAWLAAQRVDTSFRPTLPEGQAGWSGPFPSSDQWRPKFVGSVESRGEYRKGDRRVQVYLAYYPTQTQDTELISWQNEVYDEDRARRLGEKTTAVRLTNGESWPVLATWTETENAKRMIWHWYEIGSLSTINRVQAKFYEVRRRLLEVDHGSAAWLVSSEYAMTPEEAQRDLEDFLLVMLPKLREATALDE